MSYGADAHPFAIAHRGGMELGPENTLITFERATALGLRYLETDVQTTKDGVPVCFHDSTLMRVTGEPGSVADYTAEELRAMRVNGTEPIPTLEEALVSFGDSYWAVDLKDLRSVGAVVDLLRTRPHWAERVCVAGAWDGWLAEATREVPGLTSALGWRSLTALIALSHIRTPMPAAVASGRFAHVPVRLGRWPVFAEQVVARAHDLGVGVIVWTVNDEHTMRRLLDCGVDGIITDDPVLLRGVLHSRGQWPGSGGLWTGDGGRADSSSPCRSPLPALRQESTLVMPS